MNDSEYERAMNAGKDGTIFEWTIEFLEGVGNNKSLAKTLRQKGQFHFGPIEYPISEFVPVLGPNETFKYYEAQETIDNRVAAMEKSFSKGWKPAPLIVTDIWEDSMGIADGAHRFKLLRRLGIEKYPTVFYFKSQLALDRFINSLG